MNNKNRTDYLLESAFEITPLGWWEWDIVNDELKLSKEVFDMIDKTSEEFNGSVDFIINNVIHHDYKKTFRDNVENAIKTGVVPSFEYLITKNDGTNAWIRLNGYALKNDDGQIISLLGTILDISIYKKYEDELYEQNSFYEALMQIIPNPIYYKDKDGLYQYCNNAFSELLGVDKEGIKGTTVHDIASPELAEIYHKADLELMVSKGTQTYESKVEYADGNIHDVIFNKSTHLDKAGNSIGLVGLIYDISIRKDNERLIDKQNLIKDVVIDLSQRIHEFSLESELYDALIVQLLEVFDHADSGTVLGITDDEHFIIEASSRYDKDLIKSFRISMKSSFIWHHSQGNIKAPGIVNHVEELVDKFDIPELIPSEKHDVLRSNLYIPLIIDGQLDKIISLDSVNDLTFTELDLSIAGYIQEQILIIHKLFELNQETIRLSRYDGLTGFMNRSFFEAIIEDRLEVAIRKNVSLTVVLFDLDDLKIVNDKYGHSSGDEYIRQFAHLLTASFRSSDLFARIGGDEFCGTFVDSDSILLEQKLNLIRETYSNLPFGSKTSEFKGRFSFGIANYPEDGSSTYELMYNADLRMYEDKKNHKLSQKK